MPKINSQIFTKKQIAVIKRNLNHGDQAKVADEFGCDKSYVSFMLNPTYDKQNTQILCRLHEIAIENLKQKEANAQADLIELENMLKAA